MAKYSLFAHSQLFGHSPRRRTKENSSVAVLGLGRFGHALALEFMAAGTEVLGIDGREDVVQDHNGLLTRVVCADSTSEEVLRRLSVAEFDCVVVAIGNDIEASVLTSSLLLELGAQNVWAEAASDSHGEILDRIGVRQVVSPERDAGRRVAQLIQGYTEIADDFVLAEASPPERILGVSLGSSRLSEDAGVMVVAFHRAGAGWGHTTPRTVLEPGDRVLIAGHVTNVRAFSQL